MKVRDMAAGFVVSAGIGAISMATSTHTADAEAIPQWSPFGTTLYTFGDANFCSGAIDMTVEAAPNQPGHVLAHVTPRGYQRGPCGNHVMMGWLGSGGGNSKEVYVRTDTGPGVTQTVNLDVGSGPAKIMADSWPVQGQFAEWYLMVP